MKHTFVRPGIIDAAARVRAWVFGCLLCSAGVAHGDGLTPLDFEPNPGLLAAYLYVPAEVKNPAPLVVALHGCTQGAADFDDETGWTALADELGFLLLLPEQSRYNNPYRCFNWFSPLDRRRDLGEPESIRHMVKAVGARYPVDPERVFVTGLSAGGGMTSVLLATHPDVFAAGAVVGGVPYGCAPNLFLASACMSYGNRMVSGPAEWARLVFEAAPPGTERWPRVSIWHDTGDEVVNPFNAFTSMEQWTAVNGIDQVADSEESVGPHRRSVFADAAGVPRVELWITRAVGHATSIDEQTGCGHDDPARKTDFVTDADLCATRRIARFWGLAP